MSTYFYFQTAAGNYIDVTRDEFDEQRVAIALPSLVSLETKDAREMARAILKACDEIESSR